MERSFGRGGYSGLYTFTPDSHPILGEAPAVRGLFLAVGFSGHGFKLSPIVGSWMAEFVLAGQKPADMRPFNFARFSTGQEIHPHYPSGVLG